MKRALSIAAKAVLAFGLLAAAGGLATARAVHQGERELRSAEALAATGKLREAVVHARQAAMWFVPGAPHVPAAYAKLVSIARLAEGRGDPDTALFAWHAVRTSALSTRWVFIPHDDELAIANASIARLSSKKAPPPAARVRDPGHIQQKMHALLARSDRPRIPWILTLLAGFLAMSAGLVHMGWKGLNGEHGFEPRRLKWGAAIALAGVVAWALALWNA